MNITRNFAAIYATLIAGMAALPSSLRNLRKAQQHCSPCSVARVVHRRYPFYYAINADVSPLDLTGYTDCLNEGVPFIRMSAENLRNAFNDWPVDHVTFRTRGIVLVVGAATLPSPTPAFIVKRIKRIGYSIITVGDAQRIIDWFESKTESNAAEYVGIGELLVPICKEVVATRAAIMIAYTPAFPKPFKFCKLSLNGIMRARPLTIKSGEQGA